MAKVGRPPKYTEPDINKIENLGAETWKTKKQAQKFLDSRCTA